MEDPLELLQDGAQVLKYKRALKACIPCRNAKVGCDHQRPCFRCTKHGIQKSCVDAPRRPRSGKKPKADVVLANLQDGSAPPEAAEQEALGDYGLLGHHLHQQLQQQRQSVQQFQAIHQQLLQQQHQQQHQPQLNQPQMIPHQPQIQMSHQPQHLQHMQQQQQQPNMSFVGSQPLSQNISNLQSDSFVPPSPTVFLAQLLNEIDPPLPNGSHINETAPPIDTPQPSYTNTSSPTHSPPMEPLSSPADDLESANRKIEALSAQITRMSIDMEQMMNTIKSGAPPSKLPVFPDNPLPSYLDASHPLNSEPSPIAIWQLQDRLLVDCNMQFARLLGHDSVPQLLLSYGVVTLMDIMGPALREKALYTCTEALVKNVRYFERPGVFVRKDGTEVKVYMQVANHGSQFVTRIRVLDPTLAHPLFTVGKTPPFHPPATSSSSSSSSSSSCSPHSISTCHRYPAAITSSSPFSFPPPLSPPSPSDSLNSSSPSLSSGSSSPSTPNSSYSPIPSN